MLKQQLTQEVVYDAETKLTQEEAHSPWSTMLKQQHKVVTLTTTAAP
jgi:hypothetical protein